MVIKKSIAEEFPEFKALSPEVKARIKRLNRVPYLELKRVEDCHAWMRELRISGRMTGLLLGESRSGKTVASKAFAQKYTKNAELENQRIKPVVYIQIPQGCNGCSSRDLFIKILKALGHRATYGTTTDLRERALETMEMFQVEILIIDEANHLKFETFSDVRHIYDEDQLGITVLLVGTTERLTKAVERDEQVEHRFSERYHLDKLSEKEFKETIRIWEKNILEMPPSPFLLKGETYTLLKKVTGRLIGRLDMLLRRAAIRSLLKGHQTLEQEILKQVASQIKFYKRRTNQRKDE